MKKIIFAIAIVFALCSACQKNNDSFTLKGNVDGLQPGDTLFLTSFLLPEWKPDQTDTFYVTTPGTFSFSKQQKQTLFYLLSYTPKDKEPLKSCILGVPILAKAGEVTYLTGSTTYFGALRKSGGLYSNLLIAREDSLSHLYDSTLIYIYQHIMAAMEANQPDSINKYGTMYNTRQKPEELISIQNELAENIHDNEYAAYLYLTRLYNIPFKDITARFEKFTPEVKASYIGKRLSNTIHTKQKLQEGNTPPDFSVTSSDGNRLSLSSFNGKYLLIYYWGICPGTFAVHPKLLNLYTTYHDKGLEVMACSNNDIFKTHPEILTNESSRKEVEPLLHHPWTKIYLSDNNNAQIATNYALTVLPTLMLISPEGIILARGYGEVFGSIEEILKKNL